MCLRLGNQDIKQETDLGRYFQKGFPRYPTFKQILLHLGSSNTHLKLFKTIVSLSIFASTVDFPRVQLHLILIVLQIPSTVIVYQLLQMREILVFCDFHYANFHFQRCLRVESRRQNRCDFSSKVYFFGTSYQIGQFRKENLIFVGQIF